MLLYKFRMLENFEQVADMLMSNRFYCPTWKELNDPLEGILGVSAPDNTTHKDPLLHAFEFWEPRRAILDQYRICSFSDSPDSVLMWSYYGNGHSGICIEADLSDYEGHLHKVVYVEELLEVDQDSCERRLRHKHVAWKHEKEYRVVFKDSGAKYICANIKSVLVGANIKESYMRPLLEICCQKGYKVEICSFDTHGKCTRFPLDTNKLKEAFE